MKKRHSTFFFFSVLEIGDVKVVNKKESRKNPRNKKNAQKNAQKNALKKAGKRNKTVLNHTVTSISQTKNAPQHAKSVTTTSSHVKNHL